MRQKPFAPNPQPSHDPRAAASSTASRFARLFAWASLIVAGLSAPALSQSLPRHFQFQEQRVLANGNSCVFVSDVTIQGDFVLVAPLSRECTHTDDLFSADEGYLFPLNGRDARNRNCEMGKGDNPKMTCSDGEVSSVRGYFATEPLRIESTIDHAAQWDGKRLSLQLDDFEIRYTKAGGSGKRPQRLRKIYQLEFTFPSGACVLEKIARSRIAAGRNQNIVSVKALSCKVL